MRYTAEQFEALISEVTEEVNLYENSVRLNKTDNWNKLIGIAALLLLVATISSGGFCHNEDSRTLELALLQYAFTTTNYHVISKT